MTSNNDSFGDLFDFDGDGETSLDEEFLAYKIFEETTKEENEDIDDEDEEIEDDFIPTYHSIPNSAPTATTASATPTKVSVPETLSKENYPQRKNALKLSIFGSIITGLFTFIWNFLYDEGHTSNALLHV